MSAPLPHPTVSYKRQAEAKLLLSLSLLRRRAPPPPVPRPGAGGGRHWALPCTGLSGSGRPTSCRKSRACSRSHHTTLLTMTPSSSISHWTSSPFCNGVASRLSVLSLTHAHLHMHRPGFLKSEPSPPGHLGPSPFPPFSQHTLRMTRDFLNTLATGRGPRQDDVAGVKSHELGDPGYPLFCLKHHLLLLWTTSSFTQQQIFKLCGSSHH